MVAIQGPRVIDEISSVLASRIELAPALEF